MNVQVVNVVEVQGVTEAVAGHHQDASAMNTAIATIATNSAHMEKQIVIEINTTVVVKKITYCTYITEQYTNYKFTKTSTTSVV